MITPSSRRSRNRVIYSTNTTTSWLYHVLHHLDTTCEVLQSSDRGPPTMGRHSKPVPEPTQPSTQVSVARLSLPEKYGSTPLKCCGFLLQCSLYFAYQSGREENMNWVPMRGSWLCSGWSSTILQRAEREVNDFQLQQGAQTAAEYGTLQWME